MSAFEQAVLEQAIDKLFNAKHFSICTVDDIGKLVGQSPARHPNYKFLQALHCVNYGDMSPVILQDLQRKVMECFTSQFHSGAVLAKALLIEGHDHVNTEDSFMLEKR